MSDTQWDWIDKQETANEENKAKGYFKIEEGDNRFLLLSHFAPLRQVYEGGKYRVAHEGDKSFSIKGVCWVAQEEDKKWVIKSARMPYTVVKAVRDLSKNDDWNFEIPFAHVLNLKATNAGTKEVDYSLQPSPKAVEIPEALLEDLKEKPSPEDIVEKIKAKDSSDKVEYPQEEIDADKIPF